MSGSFFFSPWAACASYTHAICGALGERHCEFSSPTLDRLGVQAGYVRDQLVTTVTQTVGLDRGIPPPLLFIQAG